MNKLFIIIVILLLIMLKMCNRSKFAKNNHFSKNSKFAKNIISDEDITYIFHAPWCGHCKTSMPEFKKAVTEAKGRIKLINSDENKDLVKQYGIKGFPTIIKGKTKEIYTGKRNATDIVHFINE